MAKSYLSKPDAYEPIYAISVVLYKIGKHKQSLDFAYQWLNLKINNEEITLNLKYIIALNWKKFYNTYKSNEIYKELITFLDKKERK